MRAFGGFFYLAGFFLFSLFGICNGIAQTGQTYPISDEGDVFPPYHVKIPFCELSNPLPISEGRVDLPDSTLYVEVRDIPDQPENVQVALRDSEGVAADLVMLVTGVADFPANVYLPYPDQSVVVVFQNPTTQYVERVVIFALETKEIYTAGPYQTLSSNIEICIYPYLIMKSVGSGTKYTILFDLRNGNQSTEIETVSYEGHFWRRESIDIEFDFYKGELLFRIYSSGYNAGYSWSGQYTLDTELEFDTDDYSLPEPSGTSGYRPIQAFPYDPASITGFQEIIPGPYSDIVLRDNEIWAIKQPNTLERFHESAGQIVQNEPLTQLPAGSTRLECDDKNLFVLSGNSVYQLDTAKAEPEFDLAAVLPESERVYDAFIYDATLHVFGGNFIYLFKANAETYEEKRIAKDAFSIGAEGARLAFASLTGILSAKRMDLVRYEFNTSNGIYEFTTLIYCWYLDEEANYSEFLNLTGMAVDMAEIGQHLYVASSSEDTGEYGDGGLHRIDLQTGQAETSCHDGLPKPFFLGAAKEILIYSGSTDPDNPAAEVTVFYDTSQPGLPELGRIPIAGKPVVLRNLLVILRDDLYVFDLEQIVGSPVVRRINVLSTKAPMRNELPVGTIPGIRVPAAEGRLNILDLNDYVANPEGGTLTFHGDVVDEYGLVSIPPGSKGLTIFNVQAEANGKVSDIRIPVIYTYGWSSEPFWRGPTRSLVGQYQGTPGIVILKPGIRGEAIIPQELWEAMKSYVQRDEIVDTPLCSLPAYYGEHPLAVGRFHISILEVKSWVDQYGLKHRDSKVLAEGLDSITHGGLTVQVQDSSLLLECDSHFEGPVQVVADIRDYSEMPKAFYSVVVSRAIGD